MARQARHEGERPHDSVRAWRRSILHQEQSGTRSHAVRENRPDAEGFVVARALVRSSASRSAWAGWGANSEDARSGRAASSVGRRPTSVRHRPGAPGALRVRWKTEPSSTSSSPTSPGSSRRASKAPGLPTNPSVSWRTVAGRCNRESARAAEWQADGNQSSTSVWPDWVSATTARAAWARFTSR